MYVTPLSVQDAITLKNWLASDCPILWKRKNCFRFFYDGNVTIIIRAVRRTSQAKREGGGKAK